MASEILGLFTTPEQYRLQQQNALNQSALQFAQMTPFQRAEMSFYKGGANLASGLGGLLGVEDPQLKLISQRQQLSQGLDMTDPASVMKIAEQAAQLGDMQFATALADYARKAQVDIATAQQKMREKTGIAPDVQVAQLKASLQDSISQLEAQPPSPERDRALAIQRNTLAGLPTGKTAAAEKDIVIAERRAAAKGLQPGTPAYNTFMDEELLRLTEDKANIKEIGVAVGSNAPVYLDVNNDQQFTYQTGKDGKQMRVPYVGGVDRTTAKTNLSVSQVGEKAFQEKLGALDAKDVTDARANRDSAIAALNTLNELSRLNDQGLISGTYATGRVGAANLLNTLGLISPKDQATLASSENYQKKAGDLILATLGGRLGAGFSNEDRKFIQGLVPQLENSPLARRQLIDFMQKKNQAIVNEMTRLEDYAREHNGLKGFKPTIPIISAPRTGVQAMTDAELRAEIAKKKAAKNKGQ